MDGHHCCSRSVARKTPHSYSNSPQFCRPGSRTHPTTIGHLLTLAVARTSALKRLLRSYSGPSWHGTFSRILAIPTDGLSEFSR
jgi:hypothetical protein